MGTAVSSTERKGSLSSTRPPHTPITTTAEPKPGSRCTKEVGFSYSSLSLAATSHAGFAQGLFTMG